MHSGEYLSLGSTIRTSFWNFTMLWICPKLLGFAGKKVLWVSPQIGTWLPWSCTSFSWAPCHGGPNWGCYISAWEISQGLGGWFSSCQVGSSICCYKYAARCLVTLSVCIEVKPYPRCISIFWLAQHVQSMPEFFLLAWIQCNMLPCLQQKVKNGILKQNVCFSCPHPK